MTETFGPEYVSTVQEDCPNCPCCTAALCAKGATSLWECLGHTSAETQEAVRGCPCSSEETTGTVAWRAGRLRVTLHATMDQPLAMGIELALRAVAAGGDVTALAEQVTPLGLRRYVAFVNSRPVITELGAVYIAARDDRRFSTPVQVETVDVVARTARVVVVGWSLTDGVTVLLDQLTSATGLRAEELPGRFLEAVANCYAKNADDVVLTGVTLAPSMSPDWMDIDEEDVAVPPAALTGGETAGV